MNQPDDARPEESAKARAQRRRRLAEVFGDDRPQQTRDDTEDPADRGRERSNDDWLRRQVPPHHG